MDNKTVLGQFSLDLKAIVVDEIALEGLAGIVIELLWKRIEDRISRSLTEKLKHRLWKIIVNCDDISISLLPEPREPINIVDRFNVVHEDMGQLQDPEEVDGPYEYCIVNNEHGSCKDYDKWEKLPKDSDDIQSLDTLLEMYGNRVVLAASETVRWKALVPHLPIKWMELFSPSLYCLLELIGKARKNGQTTTGKSNITKICKDAKLLFYHRKQLADLDIVKTVDINHCVANKSIKAKLIRLTRFAAKPLENVPKRGPIATLIQHLSKQPRLADITDVLFMKNISSPALMKKLKKSNLFRFFQEEVTSVNAALVENRKRKKTVRYVQIALDYKDSTELDDEPNIEPLNSVYKVGVDLQRQGLDLLIDAGRNGLTQLELMHKLGLEFYTGRTLCRMLLRKKLVREAHEDSGRQRWARFYAIAASNQDQQFATEKSKFLEYLKNPLPSATVEEIDDTLLSEEQVPKKKFKLDEQEGDEEDIETLNPSANDKAFTDLLNTSKGPTIRQLKIANGVLTVTREKLVVSGFRTLGCLVQQLTKEAPMDSRPFKKFVLSLAKDGQIVVYQLKWPIPHQYTYLICAANVPKTHPLVKQKYREICVRAYCQAPETTIGKTAASKPCTIRPFQRYMKVKKLHLYLYKLLYGENAEQHPYKATGFSSLLDLLPELTVKLAVGHLSAISLVEIAHLKITENLLDIKLKDTPKDVFRGLLKAKSIKSTIRENLTMMASFGLIQYCTPEKDISDRHTGMLTHHFFVNRNAKLIDTRGDWPRDVDPKTLELSFRFDSIDDVKEYWTQVFDIATHTTVSRVYKKRDLPDVPLRSSANVFDYDKGIIYGDGKGACGFNSSYFIEMLRNWKTMNHHQKRIKSVKVPRRTKKVKKTVKSPSKPKILRQKIVQRKADVKSGQRPVKKFTERTLIKWTQWDDYVITLCKAAMSIMSPVPQPGSILIMSGVAKALLEHPHKTQRNCDARAKTLERNPSASHLKQRFIHEAKRHHAIISKYEGLLRTIKLRYQQNLQKYFAEAKIPLLELIAVLIKVSKIKTEISCVARNLAEFHENYTIVKATTNRSIQLFRVTLDDDIQLWTAKESLMMAVHVMMKSKRSKDIAIQVYHFLSIMNNETIRIATEQLRKSGALAVKDKNTNSKRPILEEDEESIMSTNHKMVMECFKLSSMFMRRFSCGLNLSPQFVEDLAIALCEKMPTKVEDSPEYNCMILEAIARGEVNIFTSVPPSISGDADETFVSQEEMFANEAKLRLKNGAVECKIKDKPRNLASFIDVVNFHEVLREFTSQYFLKPFIKKEIEDNKIIAFLKIRCEKGATFDELLDKWPSNLESIIKYLEKLEEDNIIMTVGYMKNVIILTEFSRDWTHIFENAQIIPRIWINIDLTLDKSFLLEYCCLILNKIFILPGASISCLSADCEFQSCRIILELCELLQKLKCVELKVLDMTEISLFSDDFIEPDLHEYFQYAGFDKILVFPTKDAVSKFSYIRKLILEDTT